MSTDIVHTGKTRWQRVWPIIACGAGLFSDGYLNGIIGSVNTILGRLYKDEYEKVSQNVSSIAFAGTVVGMLFFGWVSDRVSRKVGMICSSCLLIIFAALAAGSYGYKGSIPGMLAALTAYRFLLGIGIGGEYPAGSVACAEATGEVKEGTRNRWFVLFTNVMIDWGFVVSAFVPLVLVWICGMGHLRLIWRLALGLGVIPPLSILYFRLKLEEPEEYKKHTMRDTKVPWPLVFKYYWWRLLIISIIWFIYDFSAYSFGIYSSAILDIIIDDKSKNPSLVKPFGWNVVINLFYIPGAVAGSFSSDSLGPRKTLTLGLVLQAAIGFIMSGCYAKLATSEHVAAFVVVYGLFLTFGEFGPGDNLGLVASKCFATAVRGQSYGIAAAVGKVGAFVGSWVFPVIIKNAGGNTTVKGQQAPFWVSSSLCVFSAVLAIFCLPNLQQDAITREDDEFRAYLTENGWDVNQMGVKELQGVSPARGNSPDAEEKREEAAEIQTA